MEDLTIEPKKKHRTSVQPSLFNPSFAASFLAAFFVVPRPLPQTSPFTMASAIHIGVTLVPSSLESDARTATKYEKMNVSERVK